MKLNIKTTGAIILAGLVLLLFFSRTIYNYNRPVVTGTKPKKGALSKLEISSGNASWAETETIYAASAGTAGSIYVREGDAVTKGQVLFEMVFDIPATERRLAETENNIVKQEADLRILQARLENILAVLAANAEDDPEQEHEFTGQAGLVALEINKAKTNYKVAQFNYEMGASSRNEMIAAENEYKSALFKYESEAAELEHNIALKQIDIENLKLARESVREILRDYRNNLLIRSPSDGIVYELFAERGKYYAANSLLVSIGVGSEFIVECVISLDNNFVNPGDSCELSNSNHALKGEVRRVRPSVSGKTVTISVNSENINDGETFDVAFEKTSASSFTLAPNSAVNRDNDGYFLYQIKKRKGIMGEEYYVDRLNVFIGDSDYQNTSIIRGITFFEPVVLTSNKALSPGQAVTLKNPEDFFEN